MCIGSAKSQPMPPVAPTAPTMADPAVQQARTDAQRAQQQDAGLASTQLTVNLGGQGAGKKKLAGAGGAE